MAYATIEVNLDDFDDDDLIDELEGRNYLVFDSTEVANDKLTSDEITAILERFQMSIPGTVGYDIYEKLRKR
jgi:hypothetical protein